LPVITYKCIGDMTEQAWRSWLDETYTRYHSSIISLVGRSATDERPQAISLTQAIQTAAAHPASFSLGGVQPFGRLK